MNIQITKTVKITDIDTWFQFAPPKGGSDQWKEGRSAKELARYATTDNFTSLITDILKSLRIKTSQKFVCEPEAETYFPADLMGTSGPRNHDLLMIGENCVIGIEAKVSESFDKTISEKRIGASNNMIKRLDGAIEYIYGDQVPDNVNVEKLRYQLFSAVIGTVEEAKRSQNKIQHAITLVLEFTGDIDPGDNYEKKIKENHKDFTKFYDSVNGKDGLIRVANSDGINCYLIKKQVQVTKHIDFKIDNTLWQ